MKPSEKEEQFFREQELKRRLEQARKEQEAMAAAERARLKELHYMHCPKCGQKLMPQKYGEIEIDVCGSCHGLWLDAQELDQILASQTRRGPFRKFLEVLGG
ncbi:MAG: zf-TFIIB domain-containing protein [Verrucomicrobiae bacterium]|nr:zf-TFIIB domain-containing protein [Verrucomicrobiae bacterium]MDW8344188.1 zf-TFIIB domain-containing protein [Verrucomicrobiae bacterium]